MFFFFFLVFPGGSFCSGKTSLDVVDGPSLRRNCREKKTRGSAPRPASRSQASSPPVTSAAAGPRNKNT